VDHVLPYWVHSALNWSLTIQYWCMLIRIMHPSGPTSHVYQRLDKTCYTQISVCMVMVFVFLFVAIWTPSNYCVTMFFWPGESWTWHGVWRQSRGFLGLVKEVSGWTWVITTPLHLQVWQLYTLQTGACDGAAGHSGDCGVLPGSVEVQVW